MHFKNLRHYLEELEKRGELKRISVEVDPELEISEIANQVVKRAGPALLFERPKGSKFSVAMNLFGTPQRTAFALGAKDLEELGKKIDDLIESFPPESFVDKLKMVPRLFELAKIPPKLVGKAPCQEVIIEEPDLSIFPVLKTWPLDGGRFLTLPLVFTKSPKTGIRNVGMYRMQVYDKNTTGMHWHPHKGGALHYYEAEELNQRLPLAVALGADPATIYSATAPLPEGVDELLFAGFLRGEPVEIVKCRTVDMEVPAEAEIVLEGYVEPQERRLEGPFGDHTGFYSLPEPYPVFHISCITHRKDAIYPATVVGKPPMEDCFLAKATERIFLRVLKLIFPEIVDLNLPVEGIFHNFAFLSIKKRYAGQAYKVMHGLWGLGQMMFTKWIIVFDEDTDVQNLSEVLWKLGNNVDPERDIIFVKGPLDVLDHASSRTGLGSKVGIDATRKLKEEGFERDWPEEIRMSPEVEKLVLSRWKEYGF